MADRGVHYTVIDGCRSCGDPRLDVVLDLGAMPLSDALVIADGDRSREARYPLTVVRCEACSLIQIRETVDPMVLYGDNYPYYSSFSDELIENARQNVDSILDSVALDDSSLVVELASNDGYLLQWFVDAGVPVLGIDPAEGPALAARNRGVPTIQKFFTKGLAEQLVSEGKVADVILGNNVLAHVPDQNELVAGMETLLAPGGRIVMEFPYVVDLVDRVEFDTIYHEHHCYFSVSSVSQLFRRHGLGLISVEHLKIHGGSLRVTFSREGDMEPSVEQFLTEERRKGVETPEYYADFRDRVEKVRADLLALLAGVAADGASVAAYGAAAKGAVLLNYVGVDPSVIEYVVDRNSHKHGLEMPGLPIAIHDPEKLRSDTPDYLLVLAWNFKEEIMRQQAWFGAQGGRFIIPIPSPVVV